MTVSSNQFKTSIEAMTGFRTKKLHSQRKAIASVVIGLIEAARFSDVEDYVVSGEPITDRRWGKHAKPENVRIRLRKSG